MLLTDLILEAHELLVMIVLLEDGSLSRHFLLVRGHQFSRAAVRTMRGKGREARNKHEGRKEKKRKACEYGRKEKMGGTRKVTCGFLDTFLFAPLTHSTLTHAHPRRSCPSVLSHPPSTTESRWRLPSSSLTETRYADNKMGPIDATHVSVIFSFSSGVLSNAKLDVWVCLSGYDML